MKFTRITTNAIQMSGEPCIRNLRIPVETIITMIAQDMNKEIILSNYPDLEVDDIHEALHFAALSVRKKKFR